LNGLDLGVRYADLRKDPVRIGQITIDKPKAVLEYADGKFNFQALADQLGGGGGGGNTQPSDKQSQPVKLIIDELTVKNAAVEVRHPMLPTPISLTIPTVTLKQIGNGEGAQNGAAIKDVVTATMSALAASAANSPQLKDLGALTDALKAQAQQALAKVQKELGQQIQSLTGNVTAELDKHLGDTGLGANKAIKDLTGGKDPSKAVDDGLKNLLGGKKKSDEKKK
jgi:citrate lyase gamma subunit